LMRLTSGVSDTMSSGVKGEALEKSY
jgi:hypothetical protein